MLVSPILRVLHSKAFIALAMTVVFLGCDLGYQNGAGLFSNNPTSGLSVIPSSTSIGVGQSMNFEVTGGTPPYQYQLSGAGVISSTGNYQAGSTTGTGTIQVMDSTGMRGTATVNVVALTSQVAIDNLGNQSWQPVPSATPSVSPTPLFRGQLIAIDEEKLDSHGDKIQSRYLKTNLAHPLVRADHLIEANREVATRVVVEDQLVVKLSPGYGEKDLEALLTKNNAHIAKPLTNVSPNADSSEVYLVSMGQKGKRPVETSLTPSFLAQRDQLKKFLQTIAEVSPYVISPTPRKTH